MGRKLFERAVKHVGSLLEEMEILEFRMAEVRTRVSIARRMDDEDSTETTRLILKTEEEKGFRLLDDLELLWKRMVAAQAGMVAAFADWGNGVCDCDESMCDEHAKMERGATAWMADVAQRERDASTGEDFGDFVRPFSVQGLKQ